MKTYLISQPKKQIPLVKRAQQFTGYTVSLFIIGWFFSYFQHPFIFIIVGEVILISVLLTKSLVKRRKSKSTKEYEDQVEHYFFV